MHAYDDEPPRGRDVTRDVWIVDDDRSIRWVLEKALAREGIAHRSFASAYEVLQALATGEPSLLVSDIRMAGESGLVLLDKVKERHPQLPVIIMTGHGDVSLAVRAMKTGAIDFIEKPFEKATLLGAIEQGMNRLRDA